MVPSPQLTQKSASRGGTEHTCPAGHGPLGTLLPSRGTQGCCVPQGRAAGLPHRLQASPLSCHTPASPRRGDPIREVISRHDSSFPCSVPWRHFDLDRNSCRRLARRIPAGDRCQRGAEGSPSHPIQPWHPATPTPRGSPSCPLCVGTPRVLVPSILTTSHPPALRFPMAGGSRAGPTQSRAPPCSSLQAHCACLRLIPAHAGISAAYTAPHGI